MIICNHIGTKFILIIFSVSRSFSDYRIRLFILCVNINCVNLLCSFPRQRLENITSEVENINNETDNGGTCANSGHYLFSKKLDSVVLDYRELLACLRIHQVALEFVSREILSLAIMLICS